MMHLEPLERRALLSAGDLDPTFGTAGRAVLPLAADLVSAAADGSRVVVAGVNGDSTVRVARLGADGRVDAGFGGGSVEVAGAPGYLQSEPVVAVDPRTGRVAVAVIDADGFDSYTSRAAVVVLRADGSPDPSFGPGGRRVIVPPPDAADAGVRRIETVSHLAFTADGSLVAAGSVRRNYAAAETPNSAAFSPRVFAVALRADGGMAGGFSHAGGSAVDQLQASPDGTTVMLLKDAGGPALARLGASGNPLPFAGGSDVDPLPTEARGDGFGLAYGSQVFGLDVASDGSFAVLTDAAPSAAPQSPLVAARPVEARLRVLRFTSAGRSAGVACVSDLGQPVRDGLALAADGSFVLGYIETGVTLSPVVLRRFDAGGSPDGSYGTGGWSATGQFSSPPTLLPQADGAVVVAGEEYGRSTGPESTATRFDGGVGRAGAAATVPLTGEPLAGGQSTPYSPAGPTAPGTARLDGSALVAVGTDGADVIRVDVSLLNVVVRINGATSTFSRSGVRNLYIDAGAGDDVVSAFDATAAVGGNVTVHGGSGNDTLVGGTGGGLYLGEAGDDEIFVYDGFNAVDGGAGNDVLHGGAGTDAMLGGPGADALYGEGGEDLLSGGEGADSIFGGAGEDLILGGEGRDILLGDGGRDRIDGGADGDKVYGGADADSLLGGASADLIFGDGGRDWINGLGGADRIWGETVGAPTGDRAKRPFDASTLQRIEQAHVDFINGTTGSNSYAVGGPGGPPAHRVVLDGTPNYGTLGYLDLAEFAALDQSFGDYLDLGDDGGSGGSADTLRGSSGDDILNGGAGADEFRGGGGRDTADYSDRTADLRITLDGAANDGRIAERRTAIAGGEYNDFGEFFTSDPAAVYASIPGITVLPREGHDPEAGEGDNVLADVEDVWSGTGDDVLVGSAAANLLMGAAGNDAVSGLGGPDTLTGGDGADSLAGGEGADVLEGGRGPDLLWGGPGVDTADYSRSTGRTSVTFDDVANDGERGEGDNVASDVELLK